MARPDDQSRCVRELAARTPDATSSTSPGLSENRHDRGTTPGEDDPWQHPIGARLRRVDVDPEGVGDRRRRERGNDQHPSHSLPRRTDESAGRTDHHEQIGNQQGQDSERRGPEKSIRSRPLKDDADGRVSHDRRNEDADGGVAGRAARLGDPRQRARRREIPAKGKQNTRARHDRRQCTSQRGADGEGVEKVSGPAAKIASG